MIKKVTDIKPETITGYKGFSVKLVHSGIEEELEVHKSPAIRVKLFYDLLIDYVSKSSYH